MHTKQSEQRKKQLYIVLRIMRCGEDFLMCNNCLFYLIFLFPSFIPFVFVHFIKCHQFSLLLSLRRVSAYDLYGIHGGTGTTASVLYVHFFLLFSSSSLYYFICVFVCLFLSISEVCVCVSFFCWFSLAHITQHGKKHISFDEWVSVLCSAPFGFLFPYISLNLCACVYLAVSFSRTFTLHMACRAHIGWQLLNRDELTATLIGRNVYQNSRI